MPLLVGPAGSAAVRRLLSLTILVAIDLTACFVGIYAALALKLMLQGDPVDPAAIWAVEQKALPVAAATMILIFAKNRLYGAREVRGGTAAIVSSVTLATVLVLGVVLLAGWRFETYYIFYSSWFLICLLRDRAAGELRERDGAWRSTRCTSSGAPCWWGRRTWSPRSPRASSARRAAAACPTGWSGGSSSSSGVGPGGRRGARRRAAPGARSRAGGRGDPDGLGRRRRAGDRAARPLPPSRAARPSGAHDGRAAVALAPGGPGARAAAVRPPSAGAGRSGLHGEARLRPRDGDAARDPGRAGRWPSPRWPSRSRTAGR